MEDKTKQIKLIQNESSIDEGDDVAFASLKVAVNTQKTLSPSTTSQSLHGSSSSIDSLSSGKSESKGSSKNKK